MNEHVSAFNRVIAFAVSKLPDSLKERQEVLGAILQLMPTKHPLRLQISEMLNALDLHERHQMQLALDFEKQINPARDGNGPTK